MRLFSLRILAALFLVALSSLQVQASEDYAPISVEFRKGMMDNHTYAARIENTSDKAISVQVLMERADGKSRKTFTLNLVPNQTKEIGLHQGWKSFSGDRVTVTCAGYSAYSQEVP